MKLSRIKTGVTLALLLFISLNPALAEKTIGQSVAKIGNVAPDFTLPEISNSARTQLAKLHGQVVLIDFWASWCGPCKQTMGHLKQLKVGYPQVLILAVSADEEIQNAARFVKQYGFEGLTPLYDTGHQVASQFGIEGMPSAILIDRKGVVRFRHDGYTVRDMPKIESELKRLLEEK